MNKKAVEMTMNIIVIAAILLLVLIVLIIIFNGRMGKAGNQLDITEKGTDCTKILVNNKACHLAYDCAADESQRIGIFSEANGQACCCPKEK
jgi:hypothetical protein